MKRLLASPILYLLLVIGIFYIPVFLYKLTPAPADTIVGLYNPFRDLYAKEYPRGVPFKNSLVTDPVRQQYPWKFLSIESLKHAQFPLWNPYSFSGTPLLANFQSGVFYPLNLVFFVFPFGVGWKLFIISQSFLAGIFMYIYLRSLRVSPYAQFLGSIVFTFSGFSIAWLEWGSILSTILWLPLILLATDHILQKRSIRWIMLLIFSEAAMFFAGHLQTAFYTLILSNLYLYTKLFFIIRHHKQKRFSLLSVAAPFFIAGIEVLITLPQWLPTLQLIGESARNIDQLNKWQQQGWFVPWQHLIQFVIPDYFGNPATVNYWGVWNYGEFIGYVGIVPLFFSILALVFRRDKKTYFFVGITLFALLFSTPNIIARLPYLLNIPFLSSTQPTRLLALVDFSLAILAALGMDTFLKKKRDAFIPLGLLAIVFIAICFVTKFIFTASLAQGNLRVVVNNAALPVLLFVMTSGIVIFMTLIKQKHVQTVLVLLLLILSSLDLLRFGQKFTPFANTSYVYPTTKTIAFLKSTIGDYRYISTDDRILPPNFSNIYHLQSIDGYDPLYLRRYGEFMAASERGVPDISAPFGFNRIITPKRIDSSIINLLGVKYILSLSDNTSSNLKKVFQEGETRIYENMNAFPRAFFVTNVSSVESKEDALAPFFSPTYDLHTHAVVEDENNILRQVSFASGSAVEHMKYGMNEIQLNVHAVDTSFLVLTDMYYPTWHAVAQNNDAEVSLPILRTDYAVRGMVVPKGEWQIKLFQTLF